MSIYSQKGETQIGSFRLTQELAPFVPWRFDGSMLNRLTCQLHYL